MKPLSAKQRELRHLQQRLFSTLQRLSPQPTDLNGLPPITDWPSTRQLADWHDISIYKARLLLLEMVRAGKIRVAPSRVNNTLRWYPCGSEV